MKHATRFSGWSLVLILAGVFACGGGDGGYVPARVARPYDQVAATEGLEHDRAAVAVVMPAPAAPSGAPIGQAHPGDFNREQYRAIAEADFRAVREQPLSTFSVDVDTASYSNVRRFLGQGQRPPADAVRIEELVNYFSYERPLATAGEPVTLDGEIASSPFDPRRALVRIGVRASAPAGRTPAKRFVFLVDVSGSMADENKLPLLKDALGLLVQQLSSADRIAIVAYAGESGVVLPPTTADHGSKILEAIDSLGAGGSTNGAAGIELAYELAHQDCGRGDNCRVLLATDGDFNVGVTDQGSLVRMIQRERDRGVFLTVLGFGSGNLQDGTMELLADEGDGSYAYIDTLAEARKVLVDQAGATLRAVAKDTKVQVEFNPSRVARYRLIGYENRALADQDLNDDRKDAGDMGDGQTVTALYELELRGGASGGNRDARPAVDPLKYQQGRAPSAAADSDELLTVKVRYKAPAGGESKLISTVLRGQPAPFSEASSDLRFASAVAGFGMLLRQSPHAGRLGYAEVLRIALDAQGSDRDGYRLEFTTLVQTAKNLDRALHARADE